MRHNGSPMTKMVCMAALTASMVGGASAAAGETAINQVQRFCTTSWSRAGVARQDWQDCTQEAIMHLLSRVPPERLPIVFAERDSSERRELHRAVWRTLQRWRRAPRPESLDGQAPVQREAAECRDDRLEAVAAVWHTITPRQQEVLLLWSKGYSVREIARKLGIAAPRVSDEKYKALEKLRELLV